MPSNQRYTRIDTLEIKALLVKRIGNHRADKYFDQLTRFLSLKTTKSEFDRFCSSIIGRENVPLHNQLIRSIIKNACLGKVPPPLKGPKRSNSIQSLFPRKGRSPATRDHKFKDRPSPLGPLGKPHSLSNDERTQEQSATELVSLGSRPPVEVVSVEEGEEVEQVAASPGVESRSSVTAPFGISMNLGVARKALPNMYAVNSTLHHQTCQNSGELPDTRLLRTRLQHKLQEEDMHISLDSANLLNNALDAYLKRLIEPCMSLVGSRSRVGRVHDSSSHRLIPSWDEVSPARYRQQILEPPRFGSMLDFQVSVESNPQLLGADWAVQLEKINLVSSEQILYPL